jgi:hypothetical protein
MKIPAKTIAAVMAGLISHTRAWPSSRLPTVIVYVQQDVQNPPPHTVFRAEFLASAMFHRAGVQVRWRMGAPNRSGKERAISIGINTSGRSKTIDQNALAYALAFEGVHITILWDRLERIAQNSNPVPVLAMSWFTRSATCCGASIIIPRTA